MRCSICKGTIEPQLNLEGEVIWDEGHNAEPLKNGRCCDTCNHTKVIPARLRLAGAHTAAKAFETTRPLH